MIPLRRWSALALSSGLLFVSGCGPGESSNPSNTTKFQNSAPGNSTSPASPPSAEANSFDEVTARLDRGGALYLYLGLAQWLDGLSAQVTKLRASIPTQDMSPVDRKQMNQMFDVGTALIKNSGIEQITGVGASSLAVEPGVYRNTFFVHHYKGKQTGLLNTMFGTAPHDLTALNLLPTDTALASNGDYDLAGFVHMLLQSIDQSGIPELQRGKAEGLQKFQESTGMTVDEFLASLGQEIDVVLTLDPVKQIEVPAGGGSEATMKIPAPKLALLIEVKDDKFFAKIDDLLTQMGVPGIIKVDEPGLKMRTSAYPVMPDFEVRPTVARWDKFFILASDDHLVRDMIAVQKGGAGFKASPAFAKVSSGLPSQGNGFGLTTQKFMDTLRTVQTQMIANQRGADAARSRWISKLFLANMQGDRYTVSGHVENGWLTVNKSPSGVGKPLGSFTFVPAALAAEIAGLVSNETPEKTEAAESLAQAK